MPPSPRSPLNRLPAPLDTRLLARSVIALPLLEAIQEEGEVTEAFKQSHEAAIEGHNAALFYDEDYPGGAAAAHRAVVKLLAEAVRELKPANPQLIDPPDPSLADGKVSLAFLDGQVERLLLALDQDDKRRAVARSWPTRFEVIIDVNLDFKPRVSVPSGPDGEREDPHPDTRRAAKDLIVRYIDEAKAKAEVTDEEQRVDHLKTGLSNQYVFARLEGRVIQALVEVDEATARKMALEEQARGRTPIEEKTHRSKTKKGSQKTKALPEKAPDLARFRTIFHIWPDFRIQSCLTNSVPTVKADAAQRAFSAYGQDITWAVMDSGIDAAHPHFVRHGNVDPASAYHADYTGVPDAGRETALKDEFGHGTHVAGIIAGAQSLADGDKPEDLLAVSHELGVNNQPVLQARALEGICGVAPKCKLVSMKVLDRFGQGSASNLIAAIAQIQSINGHGRELHIHGVNISLGYPFEPRWFACGHSPLCVEINRLVKSGVVVVIAAGNTGYGTLSTKEGASDAAMDLTINDPGNAEFAITVGSTHRDSPHVYGVSFFSSKGPTGDGRLKPDLLAPGEKIISCAAKNSRLAGKEADNQSCRYFETSGTSMAAPHVSGAVAAFLSIRREFIGDAEKVKAIFMASATDLGRARYFQGAGLIDLMRAIQSV